MDLKELKKLTNYARKAGLRSVKVGDVEIEFLDAPIKKAAKPVIDEPHITESPEATLEQINDYIYGQPVGLDS